MRRTKGASGMSEPKTIDVGPPMTVRDAISEVERRQPQEPYDLLKLAVEKGADVGTLERLMVVRKELLAERAKTAYFDALAAFQKECPIITKSTAVVIDGSQRYKYAPIDKIVEIVGPLLEKHGFSVDRDADIDDKWVTAIVTVHHRLGHSETKRFKVPHESKAGMSPQQKFGAAGTFAERYAFCGALGIRTGERDNDAISRDDSPETVTQLRAKLWNLLKPVRGPEKNWNIAQQWLWDEIGMDPERRVQDLGADGLRDLIKAVTKKLNA